MAEWLYEEGIGENRAILVEDGRVLEAAIELPVALKAGAVVPGRVSAILIKGRRGLVATRAGDVLVEPLPAELTEGQGVRVEIVREPLSEEGRDKIAKGRVTDHAEREATTLRDRIGPSIDVRPFGSDPFEKAGWSDLLEEARTGQIAFAGGALRMNLTPAMTLFDVDGALPPAELAVAAAAAAAAAIRRFGIGGSIGIDLPTVASKAERQRAAAALDAVLPPPFERTAVNGFGFLQVVRRRERASLPEIIRADPAGAAARALLRRAERQAAGGCAIVAAPAVVARLEAHVEWLETLARRTGGVATLRADPALPTWSGHVQPR
ncbi:MAG TPA: ribonuclease [Allosphingosinicella sp.]|nr:ribonuclease [Allosphingosinicella sp.]